MLSKKEFHVEMIRNGARMNVKVWANNLYVARKLFEKRNQRQIRHIKWRISRDIFDLNPSPFGYDESLTINHDLEEKVEQCVERLIILLASSPKPIMEHVSPQPKPELKLESRLKVQSEPILEPILEPIVDEFMFL